MPDLSFSGSLTYSVRGKLTRTALGVEESAQMLTAISDNLATANSFWDIRNKTLDSNDGVLTIDLFNGADTDIVGMGVGRNQCNDLVTFSYVDFFLARCISGVGLTIRDSWSGPMDSQMILLPGDAFFAFSPSNYGFPVFDGNNDLEISTNGVGTTVIDLIIIGRK